MFYLSRARIWLSASLAMALAACYPGNDNGGWQRDEQQIPAVEAVEVRHGSLPLEERLAGSVVASNQTEIYAEVAGRIVEVMASDGDRVEAGMPLVRLRDTQLSEQLTQANAGLEVASARVAQAEANRARAEATLERMEAITARNLGSRADLDTARADALSAAAQLQLMQAERQQAVSLVEQRRVAVAETIVRAPVSGVIGARDAEVGQMVSTSTPLFVIGDPNDMRVTITLTQRMLGYIDAGTPVNVYVDPDATETPLAAAISRISPFLHPVTRTTGAEIDIGEHGGRLRPGMFVTVDVLYGQTELAPLVPNSAIYRDARAGREGVWVAAVGDAVQPAEPGATTANPEELDPVGPVAVAFVPVDIIGRGRETSAIEGIEPGQWVVTVGHHLMRSNESGLAIIQPTPWDHILRLQDMQTRDLLNLIDQRQDQISNGGGAQVPN